MKLKRGPSHRNFSSKRRAMGTLERIPRSRSLGQSCPFARSLHRLQLEPSPQLPVPTHLLIIDQTLLFFYSPKVFQGKFTGSANSPISCIHWITWIFSVATVRVSTQHTSCAPENSLMPLSNQQQPLFTKAPALVTLITVGWFCPVLKSTSMEDRSRWAFVTHYHQT